MKAFTFTPKLIGCHKQYPEIKIQALIDENEYLCSTPLEVIAKELLYEAMENMNSYNLDFE